MAKIKSPLSHSRSSMTNLNSLIAPSTLHNYKNNSFVISFELFPFKKIIALGLILLLSLSLPTPTAPAIASPDEVKWSRVNLPTEGKAGNWVLASGSDVQYLTMARDGTLYAYGKGLTYTLYQSTDGGDNWSYLGNVSDNIVAIALAPDDANTIYYATSSRVYRSTDGGKTFASLPANPGGAGGNNIEITALTVAYLNRNLIAVATRDTDNAQFGGVYLLDEEQIIPSWVSSTIGSYDVYAVAFSPNYTTDRQLLAVATDETDTWVMTRIGEAGWGAHFAPARLDKDNSGTPTSVAVTTSATIAFPSDYDVITGEYTLFIALNTSSGFGDVYQINAVPGNSSATDLNIGANYGQSNLDVTGLAVMGDAANANLLAGAAANAQTYFSADGGRSWTRNRKGPTGGSKTYVLMAPDFPSRGKVYAATSGTESAFSVSEDRGLIWSQIGLIDTQMSTIVDLAPSPNYRQDNTLFLLTFGGEHSLWQSQNSGTTWERILSSTMPNIDSLDFVGLSPQRGSRVVFLAGSSSGQPTIWRSSNYGQNFSRYLTTDPATSASFPINAWAVANDTTLFIGSYDGSKGLVYLTTNSGLTYSTRATAGSQTISSIILSPNYEQDRTTLAGNTNGWVFWSKDNGASFEPLPPDATSPPLTGTITVAFDADFSHNRIVYAASSSAGKGVYRFTIGSSTDWESIDSTLPSSGTLNQVVALTAGTLYTTNSQTDDGMERSLNPAYSLGPTFETVTRGLSDNATLFGLWWQDNRLWSVDTFNTKLMTFNDILTSPVSLASPSDGAAGTGTLVNNNITNVSLDWEPLNGATNYQWQLDNDTDFSSIPSGFEGNTKASSVQLPNLAPATTYYWRVRATQPVLSPWSAKRSFTTSLDTESTTAIKLESPKAGAAGVPIRPLFQWSVVPGAETYELLVSTDINFANPSIVKTGTYSLPTTAWQSNISLNYSTTYYWKVRAVSAKTKSAWSAVGAFTTEPAPAPAEPAPATSAPAPVQGPAPAPSLSPVPPPTPPSPTVIAPLPPPTSPVLPPAPPLTYATGIPEWVIYLIGALLLIIILLLFILLVLTIGVRRA